MTQNNCFITVEFAVSIRSIATPSSLISYRAFSIIMNRFKISAYIDKFSAYYNFLFIYAQSIMAFSQYIILMYSVYQCKQSKSSLLLIYLVRPSISIKAKSTSNVIDLLIKYFSYLPSKERWKSVNENVKLL